MFDMFSPMTRRPAQKSAPGGGLVTSSSVRVRRPGTPPCSLEGANFLPSMFPCALPSLSCLFFLPTYKVDAGNPCEGSWVQPAKIRPGLRQLEVEVWLQSFEDILIV